MPKFNIDSDKKLKPDETPCASQNHSSISSFEQALLDFTNDSTSDLISQEHQENEMLGSTSVSGSQTLSYIKKKLDNNDFNLIENYITRYC